jgi:Tol biopolymer transport system component
VFRRLVLLSLGFAVICMTAFPANSAFAAGGKIAFVTNPNPSSSSSSSERITVINDDGTVPTYLTDPGPGNIDENPAWSPDGSKIVFTRGIRNPQTGNYERDMYIVNVDGSGLTQLTATATDERTPDWSPD